MSASGCGPAHGPEIGLRTSDLLRCGLFGCHGGRRRRNRCRRLWSFQYHEMVSQHRRSQLSVHRPSLKSDAEPAGLTVLVVDDHAGFRRALESLVRSAGDLVLLGAACGGEEAVRLSAQLRPRVVVMDLGMPGVNGVEATRRLRDQQQPPVIVALSGSHELIREAVAAGAAFTVLKDENPARLLDVIRAAAVP